MVNIFVLKLIMNNKDLVCIIFNYIFIYYTHLYFSGYKFFFSKSNFFLFYFIYFESHRNNIEYLFKNKLISNINQKDNAIAK